MEYKLEVIGFSAEGCRTAQAASVHRVELCDNPGEGGTTPSYGFIKEARKLFSNELYCMIRPRGGDFLYSNEEFEMMKTDILLCKQLGCDGIVLGILCKDGTVDKKRCSQLVELAYPLGVTFHRAFDRTIPFTTPDAHCQALEDVIDTGCERILTSGFFPTAMEGAAAIAQLIQQANERIIIMPGSGVRKDTIAALVAQTGATEFHTSARTFSSSNMQYINPNMKEELKSVSVDEAELKNIMTTLQQLQA